MVASTPVTTRMVLMEGKTFVLMVGILMMGTVLKNNVIWEALMNMMAFEDFAASK